MNPASNEDKEQKEKHAAEMMEFLARFCSVISHELKNPIASLKNISYFLKKTIKSDDDRVNKMLDLLSSEIDRTNGIIVELADLSRVKNISKELMNLKECIEKALGELNPSQAFNIIKNIDDLNISADRIKLTHAIKSVLRNACDAMPGGGEIKITTKNLGQEAQILIEDAGCGMDAETLEKAFEPAFSTKTKVLGLGLTVAREICEKHYGTISLQSQKDKGTIVEIRLPIGIF
jgi:two-component system, NtrC family, sensor histidine kinase HydH